MSDSMLVKSGLRRLPAVAAVWLLIAAILAVQFWPDMPRSWSRWFLLFAFGPPLYVLGEAFFGWLFSAHGRAASSKRFSIARIAIALPAAIVAFVLYWWLSSLLIGA